MRSFTISIPVVVHEVATNSGIPLRFDRAINIPIEADTVDEAVELVRLMLATTALEREQERLRSALRE